MELQQLQSLPMYRPARKTPHELGEAATALVNVFSPILDANGEEVHLVAAKGLAQLSFETATFASCYNENVGNLRTPGSRTDKFPFFLMPGAVDEYAVGKDGKVVRYVARRPGDPLRIFASFEFLESGISAWLGLIRDHYPLAWSKLTDPQARVEEFVTALAADPRHAYYTADPKVYARGSRSRYTLCLAAVMGRKLAPVLRLGSRGEDVEKWLYLLEKHGFGSRDPEGFYGESSKEATRAWQRANGLAEDGNVGPISREAMGLSPFAEAA